MILLKQFLTNELHLDPEKYLNKFILYEKLLLDWNKKINLISRKSESIEEHILNSIFFLTKYKFNNIRSIADIGTGGGFPGIPLKILFPEMKVLLVDSIQKKVNVLNDIIKQMDFKNIEAVCGRAEEISKDDIYKGKFDAVISKAVSSLDNLFLWENNFLNDNRVMLCIKGGDIEKELYELNKLGYYLTVEVINFDFEANYMIKDKKLVIIK
ncbi:MAG: 16S rRNA (guanine(527)-N(7))-methyltransferase RsmG [Bacteroidota bacterium]|nr:16S rRNA (guanine(527)-N(7))-methyltransferase RsmG [Bacteroidota bacterium]